MFNDIKREATSSLIKVKIYLAQISSAQPVPPEPTGDFFNSLKGLFFVYLYGIFESVVTKTTRRTIEYLNDKGITISQCKYELFDLILSPEFDALSNVGTTKKWQKRWDISNKINSNSIIQIIPTILPTDGGNIDKTQLDSIRQSFGNSRDIFPYPEIQGYLSEMVLYRNHIAHGDELPQDIGRKFTINELELRLMSIEKTLRSFHL